MPCSKLWRFAAMGKQGRLCLSKSFGIRLKTGLNASTERVASATQEEDAVPNQNGYFGIPQRLGKLQARNQLRLRYREGRFRRNPSRCGGTYADLSRDGLWRRSRFRRKYRFGGRSTARQLVARKSLRRNASARSSFTRVLRNSERASAEIHEKKQAAVYFSRPINKEFMGSFERKPKRRIRQKAF